VMVTLQDILGVLDTPLLRGDGSVRVTGLSHDSRSVKPGWIFIAIAGETADGHAFISRAIQAGAVAVIAEKSPDTEHEGFPWITVPDTKKALGTVAALLFGKPTEKLVLVGITGTNGKTTLTYLLESIVKAAGGFPGVVGTISYRWGGSEQEAARTTPEASDLQAYFASMVEAGVTHAFIEVSSHGLHRGRLNGCQFDLGVFTNLTQDHLDYHGNIEEYYCAKRLLFTELLPQSTKTNRRAVINLDDAFAGRLRGEIGNLPLITYGISSQADVRPSDMNVAADGISGTVMTPRGGIRVHSRLTGSFNLSNILAAIAVADSLRIPFDAIASGIDAVEAIPGRLERIPSETGSIFVDYAHTPSALKNVLEALHAVRTGRIVTIMGCGGDRDKTKRPLMGMEAAAGSDFVVVTSDNPRTEEPLSIMGQVEDGILRHGFTLFPEACNGHPLQSGRYKLIEDRRQAIAWAIQRLNRSDILLVAGKGHETYQEMNGVRYPFDDRQVIREELAKQSSPATSAFTMKSDRDTSGRECS